MPASLNWVDVLNEQATWSRQEDLANWYASISGRQPALSVQAVEDFQETLNFLRRQVSALHFHERLDLASLHSQLGEIQLGLAPENEPQDTVRYPLLRARLRGSGDDALLRSLQETLLVQFAQFLADRLDDPANPGIARCEGLYREGSARQISPVPSFPATVELRWRREIPALVDSGLDSSPEVQRCADFFVPRGKARFCSDDCRFRTFQLTKQLEEPGYLAAKQKRYRDRRQK